MRIFIFLIVFFFSFSVPASQFFPKIQPQFQYDVVEFINDSNGRVTVRIINPLSMKEATLSWSNPRSDEDRTIGVCWWLPLGPNRIEIDKLFWKLGSPISKKALIYHELGHCVCNRNHIPPAEAKWLTDFLDSLEIRHVRAAELPDGCPKSLMSPEIPSDVCLQRHWGLYKDELFKTCTPNSTVFLSL